MKFTIGDSLFCCCLFVVCFLNIFLVSSRQPSKFQYFVLSGRRKRRRSEWSEICGRIARAMFDIRIRHVTWGHKPHISKDVRIFFARKFSALLTSRGSAASGNGTKFWHGCCLCHHLAFRKSTIRHITVPLLFCGGPLALRILLLVCTRSIIF